jgi:hypothetical protein
MNKIQRLIREVLATPPKKDKCNCGCHSCENIGNPGPILNENLDAKIVMTENMQYHVDNKLALTENTFRYGSETFLSLWAEARYLYSRNAIHVNELDKELITETDLGEYGIYEGKKVPLDLLMIEESEVGGKEDVEFTTSVFMLPYIELLKAIERDYGVGDAYFEIEQAIFDKDIDQIPSILRRYELDKEYSHLTRVNEAISNTHKIVLNFSDERLIKRFQTTPTFQKMLAPNQIKNLKIGDNELIVNNVSLNGLQRMESMGLYKLTKNINETEKKKKNPPLGKPKRGGSKKFYVYVRDPKSKRIKKVSFGMAGGGLRAKLNNPKARQAFAKRHDCANKKDKTKASYWSCRLPRYAKALGFTTTFSGYW